MALPPSVAAKARTQRGLITSRQLAAAGVSPGAISRLADAGLLTRLHRGVHLVGAQQIDFATKTLSAVLACGDGAFAAGRASAFIWKLLEEEPAVIDVAVHRRQTRDRSGIRTHEMRLSRRDLRRRDGVPLTSPSLTLLDLAAWEGQDLVERALNEALLHRLMSQPELASLVARHPGHRGLSVLLPILRADAGGDFSRKEAERRMWKLLQTSGLPLPRRNRRLYGYEVDFLWPELRLIVELDGYRWHSTRARLNRDRERDATMAAHGHQTLRFSFDQLLEPERLVARLAAAIALAEARGDPAAPLGAAGLPND